MAHPPPDTFCRFFGLAFFWTTFAASAVLVLAVSGLPRLVFGS